MTITNILLMLVVIAIAVFVIYRTIKKKQTAEVDNVLNVDDKTYTIEKIIVSNKNIAEIFYTFLIAYIHSCNNTSY